MLRLIATLLILAALCPAPAQASDDGMNYGCRKSTDCAIAEIPSVCGKVPVCANKNTAVPQADVPRTAAHADLCEFEPVTGCYCLANKCRANREMSHFPRYDHLNQ